MQAAIATNSPLAAVTGALSYLGSHVVFRMLHKGYYVRAIVPQGAPVDFLMSMPGADTRLQIFPVRDPAAQDGYSSLLLAFRGVSTVVHAVSFSTHAGLVPKAVASKRIVDALKIALDAASAAGNVVTKFIYLSSGMTVFDPSQHTKRHSALLTESDWFDCTRSSSRDHAHAFAFAHTVAELRLWARAGRGSLPFKVCTVVPSFVLGPILSARHVSSTPSVEFLATAAAGKAGSVRDVAMSPVDVRDVARAVTAVAERSEIGGRLLLCASEMSAKEVISVGEQMCDGYAWNVGGKRWSWGGKVAGHDWEFVAKDRVGKRYSFSQTRASEELGLKFRPVEDTIRDTVTSLVTHGVLPKVAKEYNG